MTETTSRTIKEEQLRRIAGDLALDGRLAKLEASMVTALLRIAKLEGTFPPAPDPVRPWAAPVTTATVTVPSTIDHTGATDVIAALSAFFATVPPNRIVDFAIPGAVYKTSAVIDLRGRANLWIKGHGNTTINNVADANAIGLWGSQNCAIFGAPFGGAARPAHITIDGFIGTAHSPNPGHLQAGENAGFLTAYGGTYLEVVNCSGSGFYGDFVTLNENAQYVWAHGNTTANVGRQNLSVVCASHVLMEDNVFGPTGYCTFDIEPESGSIANIDDIVIRRNTCGVWGNDFLSVDGAASGKVITNVTVEDNILAGASLLTIWGQPGSARMSNVVFRRNSSDRSTVGPVLQFRNVDGLTVTGNTQPLSSGTLVSAVGCTGATTSPNP